MGIFATRPISVGRRARRAQAAAWVSASVLVAGVMVSAGPETARAAPEPSGLPIPRFVTLRAEEANMRTGPGEQYPIKWTYQRAGLPVEVVAEYHTWRRIRDWQGTEGWMHSSMLSGRRSIMVIGEVHPLHASADAQSRILAEVEPKVTGQLESCPAGGAWCRVKIDNVKGWLKRTDVWGVYPGETVE
ncbi:MAG: SH3 domain-containing protein [Rhodospirillales bacterium]